MRKVVTWIFLSGAVLCGCYACVGESVKFPDVEEVVDRQMVNYPANSFVISEDGTCTWKDYVRVFKVKNVDSVQACYDAIRDEVKLGEVVKSAVRKEYAPWTRRATRIEIRKAVEGETAYFEVSAYYDPVEVPPIKL